MKKGVRIINSARGGVLDEDVLYQAILNGKVAGAALDVFAKEPPTSPLVKLKEVIAVPHIGASTVEGQKRVGVDVAKKIIEFFFS